ncbi:hypothetical protein L596_000787 [Steinernema carpocapsae]|uniref:Reverse transcriptase domain-containing protein n=1 Tax=Steinernema carpocapsae TaxID=34508 RepID=A0A4V6I776_STECR|nr:hypothetical protein L596_000787 [Steinernema carpocapsae]
MKQALRLLEESSSKWRLPICTTKTVVMHIGKNNLRSDFEIEGESVTIGFRFSKTTVLPTTITFQLSLIRRLFRSNVLCPDVSVRPSENLLSFETLSNTKRNTFATSM